MPWNHLIFWPLFSHYRIYHVNAFSGLLQVEKLAWLNESIFLSCLAFVLEYSLLLSAHGEMEKTRTSLLQVVVGESRNRVWSSGRPARWCSLCKAWDPVRSEKNDYGQRQQVQQLGYPKRWTEYVNYKSTVSDDTLKSRQEGTKYGNIWFGKKGDSPQINPQIQRNCHQNPKIFKT